MSSIQAIRTVEREIRATKEQLESEQNQLKPLVASRNRVNSQIGQEKSKYEKELLALEQEKKNLEADLSKFDKLRNSSSEVQNDSEELKKQQEIKDDVFKKYKMLSLKKDFSSGSFYDFLDIGYFYESDMFEGNIQINIPYLIKSFFLFFFFACVFYFLIGFGYDFLKGKDFSMPPLGFFLFCLVVSVAKIAMDFTDFIKEKNDFLKSQNQLKEITKSISDKYDKKYLELEMARKNYGKIADSTREKISILDSKIRELQNYSNYPILSRELSFLNQEIFSIETKITNINAKIKSLTVKKNDLEQDWQDIKDTEEDKFMTDLMQKVRKKKALLDIDLEAMKKSLLAQAEVDYYKLRLVEDMQRQLRNDRFMDIEIIQQQMRSLGLGG